MKNLKYFALAILSAFFISEVLQAAPPARRVPSRTSKPSSRAVEPNRPALPSTPARATDSARDSLPDFSTGSVTKSKLNIQQYISRIQQGLQISEYQALEIIEISSNPNNNLEGEQQIRLREQAQEYASQKEAAFDLYFNNELTGNQIAQTLDVPQTVIFLWMAEWFQNRLEQIQQQIPEFTRANKDNIRATIDFLKHYLTESEIRDLMIRNLDNFNPESAAQTN